MGIRQLPPCCAMCPARPTSQWSKDQTLGSSSNKWFEKHDVELIRRTQCDGLGAVAMMSNRMNYPNAWRAHFV